MSLRKTVGLVLGCGSSRGWAHIGAIEALEEANIPIDLSSAIISKQKLKKQQPRSEKTLVEQEEKKRELIKNLSAYYENAGL